MLYNFKDYKNEEVTQYNSDRLNTLEEDNYEEDKHCNNLNFNIINIITIMREFKIDEIMIKSNKIIKDTQVLKII